MSLEVLSMAWHKGWGGHNGDTMVYIITLWHICFLFTQPHKSLCNLGHMKSLPSFFVVSNKWGWGNDTDDTDALFILVVTGLIQTFASSQSPIRTKKKIQNTRKKTRKKPIAIVLSQFKCHISQNKTNNKKKMQYPKWCSDTITQQSLAMRLKVKERMFIASLLSVSSHHSLT